MSSSIRPEYDKMITALRGERRIIYNEGQGRFEYVTADEAKKRANDPNYVTKLPDLKKKIQGYIIENGINYYEQRSLNEAFEARANNLEGRWFVFWGKDVLDQAVKSLNEFPDVINKAHDEHVEARGKAKAEKDTTARIAEAEKAAEARGKAAAINELSQSRGPATNVPPSSPTHQPFISPSPSDVTPPSPSTPEVKAQKQASEAKEHQKALPPPKLKEGAKPAAQPPGPTIGPPPVQEGTMERGGPPPPGGMARGGPSPPGAGGRPPPPGAKAPPQQIKFPGEPEQEKATQAIADKDAIGLRYHIEKMDEAITVSTKLMEESEKLESEIKSTNEDINPKAQTVQQLKTNLPYLVDLLNSGKSAKLGIEEEGSVKLYSDADYDAEMASRGKEKVSQQHIPISNMNKVSTLTLVTYSALKDKEKEVGKKGSPTLTLVDANGKKIIPVKADKKPDRVDLTAQEIPRAQSEQFVPFEKAQGPLKLVPDTIKDNGTSIAEIEEKEMSKKRLGAKMNGLKEKMVDPSFEALIKEDKELFAFTAQQKEQGKPTKDVDARRKAIKEQMDAKKEEMFKVEFAALVKKEDSLTEKQLTMMTRKDFDNAKKTKMEAVRKLKIEAGKLEKGASPSVTPAAEEKAGAPVKKEEDPWERRLAADPTLGEQEVEWKMVSDKTKQNLMINPVDNFVNAIASGKLRVE